METNFYGHFKGFSNIELLKIVHRPSGYQPEAVEAANIILSNREVSPEESMEVQLYYEALDNKATAKAAELNTYKDKLGDFFQPVLNPGDEVTTARWLKLLLFALVVQYLYGLYNAIVQLIDFSKCVYCDLFLVLFPFLNLLYIHVVFYLLYKKHRWGWIILFADTLFTLISRLSSVVVYYRYYQTNSADTTFLMLLFFKAALLLFLWKKEIIDFFDVTDKLKKNTAMLVGVGSVIVLACIYLTF